MEYLLKQFSTQVGDPIPEKVKECFGNDEALFKYLKPSNYKPELGPLLKQRGETPAQFYRRMVKAAYTIRLGGEEHLNSYNWERPMSELEALDRQDEERQGEVDEGGPIEEQEEKIRKQLTPGELITMHKDGRCTAKPVHCTMCIL